MFLTLLTALIISVVRITLCLMLEVGDGDVYMHVSRPVVWVGEVLGIPQVFAAQCKC